MIGSIRARQDRLEAAFSPWSPTTLHGALDRAADRFADRAFLLTDERCWTYREMVAWSERLASGLSARGIAAGDKIAIVLANYPEYAALKFALSRLGAIAVPINILGRADELRYLLRQSDAAMLVTMDRFRGTDYLAMLYTIASAWHERQTSPELPRLREVIVLATGGAPLDGALTAFAELEASDPIRSWPEVAPTDDCDIIYTSGTTGDPKGVQLTHDMLTRTAFGSAYARAFEDGHRIIFSLPMYHVYGYVEGLLSVMWVGGAIVPQLRFDAHGTLAAIERHRATDALLIPAMTLAMLDAAEERSYDLSSLHFTLSSGGRAPIRVWQGIRERLGVAETTTGYGMTEVTASSTVTRPDDPEERLLTTNGRQRDVGPAADPNLDGRLVTYRAIDADGVEVATREIGELVARGLGVTRGYYDKPEATAAAFTADGWLRTGDLGRIDEDGYITLAGRSKESYRCGGEQVLPTEIEDLLTTHPDVLQAHVVPVPDERMGEIGAAFVVRRPGATVETDTLIALVAARLARFKVPRHMLLVDEAAIPVTASGRARKFLLTEKAIAMLGLS